MNNLFSDSKIVANRHIHNENTVPILKSEIKYNVRNIKNGKAPGPDNVHGKIKKLIVEDNLDLFVKIFNSKYEIVRIRQEWLSSAFASLPQCNNNKKDSLLQINIEFMRNVAETEQLDLRNVLGIGEAMFSFIVLM